MNPFKTVFLFELRRYISGKAYRITTIGLMLFAIILISFPRIRENLHFPGNVSATGEESVILLINGAQNVLDESREKDLLDIFSKAFPEGRMEWMRVTAEEARQEVIQDNADCAFYFTGENSYTYYVKTLELSDSRVYRANEALEEFCAITALKAAGVPEDNIEKALHTKIIHETVSLGKNQQRNFFYAYFMVMALYIVILYYGQSISAGVAAEKSSRTMELLVTSVKPTPMIFGKVLAASVSSLFQVLCIAGSAALSFQFSGDYWQEGSPVRSVMDMPTGLLRYMLLFFLLGFLIYAFLYGATGSTVTKMEEAGQATMPVTLLFIAGFLVSIFSMTGNATDSALFRACSYIPFTSPMVMFSRITMSEVPAYQIAVSAGILILSVILTGILSARIYRAGILAYGKRPSLGALIKTALIYR